MTELIETFSGAQQVIPDVRASNPNRVLGGLVERIKKAKPKPEPSPVSLSDLFRERVVQTNNLAWYVNHWTTDPGRYGVLYLARTPLIRWTNENMDERDPLDLPGSTWVAEDVAEWFAGCTHRNYEHVVTFHSAGVAHRLKIAAFNVILDGEDRWAEYVDLGVRGAMGALVRTFDHLDSIDVFLNESGAQQTSESPCLKCKTEDEAAGKENRQRAEE